ncbi:MAG: hypothetical protein WC197_10030, partial [Candidatus Gastranaerophilaceae bacterium]
MISSFKTNNNIIVGGLTYKPNPSLFNFSNISKPLVLDNQKVSKTKSNLPIIATSIIGTLIPLLILKKTQKAKSLLNVQYETLKEVLFVGFGSIAGGLCGGLAFGDKKDSKKVIKESVFQYLNFAIPACIVT